MSLGNAGEQFFACQGTWNTSTKTFNSVVLLAAVNYYGIWDNTINACTYIPTASRDPGTSVGGYAFLTAGIQANGYYNGPKTGSAATVRANILTASYWVFSGSSATPTYALPASGSTFSVGSTSTISSINRISATPINSSNLQFTATFANSVTGLQPPISP